MKAVVRDRYGSPDLLRLEGLDWPLVGADDVLVRVHAAGLDQGVWHVVTGLPYAVRLAGLGVLRPKVRVPGTDVAGTVVAVGRNVTRFRLGDEVFGTCVGSLAQYASAHQHQVAVKPEDVTFEQAATVPTSGLTALQGLRDSGKVEAGQSVLVIGAGGGVGTLAVQLAKAFGAQVTGVCSASKADLVRSIAARHLRKNAKKALEQAGITSSDHPIQRVLEAAFQSLAGWDAFCVAAQEFPQIARYSARNDAQVRDQVARRAVLPQHHSSAALETVLERVRQQVERRTFAFRNQRRTNPLPGLMRNHEVRVDDLDHCTELLRETARASGGRIEFQRRGYCTDRAFDLRP